MPDISAIVITLNEENNIGRCLESLKFCEEIIVVDSGSKDRTVETAEKYTDKIKITEWRGYGAQKNYAASLAENDWILSIDADEEISAELAESIKSIDLNIRFKAFTLNRHTQYLGRWINHGGWYPQYITRLYHKSHARWDEKCLIHESVIVEGEAGKLKGDLRHYSYLALSAHIQQMNKFTELAAQEYWRKGRRFSVLKMLVAPPAEFMKKYLFKLGFLDGLPGLIMAVNSAYYVFLKQAKLYELQMKNN